MRNLCAQHGAVYVLVNTPEHPERFAAQHGPATHRDYHERIRDPGQPSAACRSSMSRRGDLAAFAKDKWFSDFHHMSPAGAARFSTLLAERFVEWQGEVKLQAAQK